MAAVGRVEPVVSVATANAYSQPTGAGGERQVSGNSIRYWASYPRTSDDFGADAFPSTEISGLSLVNTRPVDQPDIQRKCLATFFA